ncbi:vancomycin high temperature exclusion protein [Dokdonia sp. Hel_I_53]|uniref:SanA/YdcF family protein n=1 Tax=Dokdonia sp. Hel_I_53 TaxID=1566287 RepID=UPI00119C11FF|nr:ElyC/SanA/YdcF family protein [Dokdonia sp. Hel_I_53]TVZ51012.1 SanA protein [Dokdonia sp. Hel_I_53]
MTKIVKKSIYTLLILGVLMISFIMGLSWYIQSSTKDQISNKIDEIPSVYTVIVLGASVRANGNLSTMLEDRVESALQLYNNGKVERFLLSGDNGTKSYNEPQAMKEYLMQQGVPEDIIFLDYAGFDTYDSMYRASSVFNVKNAVVVTQEFHLPRAIYIANKLNLNYYGLIGDKRAYQQEDRNKKRELLANVKAFLELTIGKEPKYLGAHIPIDGPPQSTYPTN